MGLPNDSTRFDVAWMVIWIILSFILIGLVCIRKLALPAVLYRPDKTFSMVFAFLQLCAFTFILAALAYDGWSNTGGNFAYGVVRAHERGSQDFATDPYSKQCDDLSGDAKDLCQSGAAAGAFTLIFGLISVLVAFALLISIVMSLLGKTIAVLDSWRAPLANIQWISTLAQVMIWGVSFHQLSKDAPGGSSGLDLGASWALTIVAFFLSLLIAMFYGGGSGGSITGGSAGAGAAQSTGPEKV